MRLGVVYKVTIDNNFIIGSSLNPKKREKEYRKYLELGLWNNDYVQNSYNKYGKENFKWEILQKDIPENILEHVEDIWIGALCSKIYDNKGGMNIRDAYRSKMSQETKDKLTFGRGKKIHEYSLDGEFIKQWESLTLAAKNKNINRNTITISANRNNSKAGGSMWSFEYVEKLPAYINLKGNYNKKSIVQKDLDNNVVKIWESASEANRNGFDNNFIAQVCVGKRPTYKGFLWEFETS